MDYEYIAYIDEAGDPGLGRIRPEPNGSSEWMVLSAFLISKEYERQTEAWTANLTAQFRNYQASALHFAKFTAGRRLLCCEHLANVPCRCFVVASSKANMKAYKNPLAEKVSLDVNWFYCWLTRVLLERVTYWVWQDSQRRFGRTARVKLVFSKRGGLSYGQMKAYFEWLRMKSAGKDLVLRFGDLRWPTIRQELVEVVSSDADAGLQFADVIASAFFAGLEPSGTGGLNAGFAKALKPRMARDPDRVSGEIAGFGVKPLPSFSRLQLHPTQRELFSFYGYPKQWWDQEAAREAVKKIMSR